MNRVRVVLLTAALGAVALLAALVPTAGEAHVSKGRSYWYWELMTKNQSYKPTDPLTMLWTHGTLAPETTQDRVRDAVTEYWRTQPARQLTFDQLCLGQSDAARKISDSGLQKATWLGDTANAARHDDDNDYGGSTSRRCLSQWHMRFWDDEEHVNYTTGHGDKNQWVLSGVHRDHSTGTAEICFPGTCQRVGTGHKVRGRWSVYRNYAVNRALSDLCGRSQWRQFPGADRKIRGGRLDGYIARIDFQLDGGGCPNGLG